MDWCVPDCVPPQPQAAAGGDDQYPQPPAEDPDEPNLRERRPRRSDAGGPEGPAGRDDQAEPALPASEEPCSQDSDRGGGDDRGDPGHAEIGEEVREVRQAVPAAKRRVVDRGEVSAVERLNQRH